jgi:hypothetical protein
LQKIVLAPGAAVSLTCGLRMLDDIPEAQRAVLRVEGVGLKARVDGEPLPSGGAVPIGRHRLQVTKVGFEPWTRELTLEQGEVRSVTPELEAYVERWTPSDVPDRSGRTVAYALGAAGLAAGIAALTVYMVADSRYTQWEQEDAQIPHDFNAPPMTQRVKANDDRLRSVWALDTAAGTLAIVSGAILVGAVITLFVTRRPDRSQAGLGLRPRTDGMMLVF